MNWDDLLEVAKAATSIYGNVADIKKTNAQANALADAKAKTMHINNYYKEADRAYKLQESTAINNFKDSLQDINTAINTLQLQGVTMQNIKNNVADINKTDDMQSILDSGMALAQEDLTYSYNAANTTYDTLKNVEDATALNRLNLMELNNMLDNIDDAKRLNYHVGTEQHIQGVQDVQDFTAFKEKPEYASIFKLPARDLDGNVMTDDKGNTIYSKNDNYVADAFTHQLHSVNGISYGNVPSYQKWQVEEIQKSLNMFDTDDRKLKLGANFELINKTYKEMQAIDEEKYAAPQHQKWLEEYSLDYLADLQASETTWDNKYTSQLIKGEIERTVINIFDDGTKRILENKEFSEYHDGIKALRRDLGFGAPLIYDEATQSYIEDESREGEYKHKVLQNPELMYHAMLTLQEKFINPTTKISGQGGAAGLLSQEYADLGLYFGSKPPRPEKGLWMHGTGMKDKMVYNLLSAWGNLDSLYKSKYTLPDKSQVVNVPTNVNESLDYIEKQNQTASDQFLSLWNDSNSGHKSSVGNMNQLVNDVIFSKMSKEWPNSLYELNENIGMIDYGRVKRGIDKELGEGRTMSNLESVNLKRDIVSEVLKEIEGLDLKNVSQDYLANEVYENIIQNVVSKYK